MSLPQVTAQGLIPHLPLSKLLRRARESPALIAADTTAGARGGEAVAGNGWTETPGSEWAWTRLWCKTQSRRHAPFLPKACGSAWHTTSPGHRGPLTKTQLRCPLGTHRGK